MIGPRKQPGRKFKKRKLELKEKTPYIKIYRIK